MSKKWVYLFTNPSLLQNSRSFGTGSFLQSRLKTIRERALRQQVSWLQSVNANRSHNPTDTFKFIDQCKFPFKEPLEEIHGIPDQLMDDLQTNGYQGILQEIKIEEFGTITAEHGDVLQIDADCLIVPIPPNLTPHCGFGLKVVELGGPSLIKMLVRRAKVLISQKIKELKSRKDTYKDNYGMALDESHKLEIGDVILTPTYGVAKTTILAFVVTPYYWVGNTREAALRLRYTFKRALSSLNDLGISSIVSPHVGESLYGYQPRDACEIMIEESHDIILQLENIIPKYSLKQIRFVDKDYETARAFANALCKIRQIKRPEYQVIPAPVYHSRNSQRIIEIDESVLKFCSQYKKITYKRHSAIRKRKRQNWLSNLKPFVWRAPRLYEPPPFMLYKSTGKPASFQLPPRPYYKKGVSHRLFPCYSGGIKGLRLSKSGKWVGSSKLENILSQRRTHEA
ncbi:conserved hypothetical protein [Theileria equi strain WA]|uniref:Macro domain-containing protein n=1 Tax=Theileria equi strain WA TaxID=1537102 RepID=L1LBI3_THEEQ|nr:conserved hypothetical protein [Theileria equi strain WA]EKX72634.1 conserved hypothetical protein [Theileria equi strain WA]|eukprot:XP_004832086.1 conserved hypothetical protein [Theileria equi strain WA]